VTTTDAGTAEAAGGAPDRLGTIRQSVAHKLTNFMDMVIFSGEIFTAIPRTAKYGTEVLRQTGIMILSSGFVIVFIQLVSGFVFAVNGHYIIRQFGAAGYVAVFPGIGGTRFAMPQMSAWILAAKVGCGLVAEIGSARINDEIDALEVMGVESKVYLVATRVLAGIIAMPFLFAIGMFLYFLGAYIVSVHVLHTVSEGGFLTILWLVQNWQDMAFSMMFGLICGLIVILVGCYYGYTARGGPVGVGQNTAKSMVVNMVMVSVVGLALGQLFWGGNPNSPIGN
jgi:phospholipid/cholesterol/gamma-HCH transport system permease protein